MLTTKPRHRVFVLFFSPPNVVRPRVGAPTTGRNAVSTDFNVTTKIQKNMKENVTVPLLCCVYHIIHHVFCCCGHSCTLLPRWSARVVKKIFNATLNDCAVKMSCLVRAWAQEQRFFPSTDRAASSRNPHHAATACDIAKSLLHCFLPESCRWWFYCTGLTEPSTRQTRLCPLAYPAPQRRFLTREGTTTMLLPAEFSRQPRELKLRRLQQQRDAVFLHDRRHRAQGFCWREGTTPSPPSPLRFLDHHDHQSCVVHGSSTRLTTQERPHVGLPLDQPSTTSLRVSRENESFS